MGATGRPWTDRERLAKLFDRVSVLEKIGSSFSALDSLRSTFVAFQAKFSGGTAGQALLKNTEDPYDWLWQTLPVSPLSSVLTTKGDVYVLDGTGTIVRFGVGSDAKILTADSTSSTGLAWVSQSSGMKYVGDWVPGPYAVDDVVRYNNKLWRFSVPVATGPSVVGITQVSSSSSAGQNLPLPVGAASGDSVVLTQANFGSSSTVTRVTGAGTNILATNFRSTNYVSYPYTVSSTDITNGFIVIPTQSSGPSSWCAVGAFTRGTAGADTTNSTLSATANSPSVTPAGAAYVLNLVNALANPATGAITASPGLTSLASSMSGNSPGVALAAGYDTLLSGASTAHTFTVPNLSGGTVFALTIPVLQGGFPSGNVVFLADEVSNLITAIGDLVVGSATGTFGKLAVGSNTQVLTADSTQTLGVKWAALPAASPSGLAIFGDGSDGTVTISSNTTLTRDMYYDTLTVNASTFLNSGSYRIFVKNTLTNNGTIHRNGNDASGQTAGAINNAGTLGGGPAGAGGILGSGTGPAGSNVSQDALGGAGGAGGAGPASGGAGGTVTAPVVANSSPRYLPNTLGQYFVPAGTVGRYLGGASGGAGGAGNNYISGGGGGAAGVLGIYAKTIVNNGTISANGGKGGNASNSSGSGGGSGGGGGGGGGLLLIVSSSTNNGTVTASGGTFGTLFGIGSNGVAGSAGTVIWLVN